MRLKTLKTEMPAEEFATTTMSLKAHTSTEVQTHGVAVLDAGHEAELVGGIAVDDALAVVT
jgi:hypothetical protein